MKVPEIDQFRNRRPEPEEALNLVKHNELDSLVRLASQLRDQQHGKVISYSKKVFIPLTKLCRDVCHYCTFSREPINNQSCFMRPDEVLRLVQEGEKLGCKEVLFTLGDKPEMRYQKCRKELQELGYESTISYLAEISKMVLESTSLLPHINAGVMSLSELAKLKEVSVSQGLMLESISNRLLKKGSAHYGSPDKVPEVRLEMINQAGKLKIPFTSGILIGIGENRLERVEALLALRGLQEKYGHIQEIIIQNFKAKPRTPMQFHPEPELEEILWTIAIARILFGPEMNIQTPPNLNANNLERILDAGINDWGGISPLTPDHVNPEAPWPELENLSEKMTSLGKCLTERLAIYPSYAVNHQLWINPKVLSRLRQLVDQQGFAREDKWCAGEDNLPNIQQKFSSEITKDQNTPVTQILEKIASGCEADESEVVQLLNVRGEDFFQVCQAANNLRKKVSGETITYVVNRNINYTNVCYFRCGFCAFSKGKMSENLRGKPYNLDLNEIIQRSKEAWDRGATEVCLQGGIHPSYTGKTYLDICSAIKNALPEIHIHAFSPLEVSQGAKTLELTVSDFLFELKKAGLGTLPGTAAEILDDEVRGLICPDKLTTNEWLDVMRLAHEVGFRTTATIMFGHVEEPKHVARHLLRIKQLQGRTNGFTEFVPLPFVHMESPIYLKGKARKGPTFREAVLIHAVARLVLHPQIQNIQTSWVKMGPEGVKHCLNAGVNDLGGTLMNESITRAAGTVHGQEMLPEWMESIILEAGRFAEQRDTLYRASRTSQKQKSYGHQQLVGFHA